MDIPASVIDGPVDLGDYLDSDRELAPPIQKQPEPVQPRAENILQMPRPVDSPPFAPSYEQSPVYSEPQAPLAQGRLPRPSQRKQLNMNPDTLRMVDELIAHVQRYSGQRDAKASELFHGLVSALYEARDLIDLQDIPSRGRWGTPTARAFPVALKNAFQHAIAEWYRKRPVVTER
jgi:hypothetical protein